MKKYVDMFFELVFCVLGIFMVFYPLFSFINKNSDDVTLLLSFLSTILIYNIYKWNTK